MRSLFFFLFIAGCCGASSKLIITVAYCPTAFSGLGATVEVDPHSGSFTILGTFPWPSGIAAGCVIENSPRFIYDGAGTLYLSFGADFGELAALDLARGKITLEVAPKDPFYVGFDNAFYHRHKLLRKGYLEGLQGTVTQHGICDDGCYELGTLSLKGEYHNITNIPFKAVMDDTSFHTDKSYFVQASYDLRPANERCAPDAATLCLLNLDIETGKINSATPSNWTAYHYAASEDASKVLAWVEGFDAVCKHPYNDFAFASVDLLKNEASLRACLSRNITVDMDEWVASFSADQTLFATGSGDAYAGQAQLLVLDTATGQPVLNTDLSKLRDQLGGFQKLFDIWDVQFV